MHLIGAPEKSLDFLGQNVACYVFGFPQSDQPKLVQI
jgi:hypothetical protein